MKSIRLSRNEHHVFVVKLTNRSDKQEIPGGHHPGAPAITPLAGKPAVYEFASHGGKTPSATILSNPAIGPSLF
jgi:hypothetical protein